MGWDPAQGGSGGGGVAGPSPASSTDNAIVRWDGAGGATLQNSVVTISDAGVVVIPTGGKLTVPDSVGIDFASGTTIGRTTDAGNIAGAVFSGGITASRTVATDLTGTRSGGVWGPMFAFSSLNGGQGINLRAADEILWADSTDSLSGTVDVAISRVSAGVLEVTNGTTGTERDLRLRNLLDQNGVQVVTTQGAAVADASGGATIDAEARTAINTLLARLRTHGLIAT